MRVRYALLLALTVLLLQEPLLAQQNGEWRTYHRDLASTRYSPLDRIDRNTVRDLAIAWRWKSDSVSNGPERANESTPLMVGGVLTLLFAGEGTSGRPMLRALDKRTGDTVGETVLPGPMTSQPMSYLQAGRQYLAFWVSDTTTRRSQLIAFALPR